MIPFSNLQAQYEAIRPEIEAAIHSVLDTRQYILGEHVSAFEREFAAYCHSDYAVAVNSGTSALHLALLAAGVQPGDEVITVPFTFIATIAAIHYCGARPVFVDIDESTFCMDVTQIQQAITPLTKAILPVHLFGQPADMDAIGEIALEHKLTVIEDAAQAHGAEYKGRRTGSLGHFGCFSFYPSKNLGAYGEGGLITTNDREHARTLRLLRDWGQDRKYHHVMRGFNYRMEGLQGAILGVKLKYLEDWTEARRSAAATYDRLLENAGVVRPAAPPESRHVYHTYTIRSQERDALQDRLAAGSIQTAIHYAIPGHLQEAYKDPAFPRGSLPIAELAATQVLSLPMFPEITAEQIGRVAQAIRQADSSRPAAAH